MQNTNLATTKQDIVNAFIGKPISKEVHTRVNEILGRLDLVYASENYKEYESLLNYLNWLKQFPFGQEADLNLDIQSVTQKLNEGHYGLDEIKRRIAEYISVVKLSSMNSTGVNAPVLLFIGVQGIGKTSMAKSMAGALGRPLYSIPLGGASSASFLRGKARAEGGTEPGQILKAIISSKVTNPLILLDELDKVSKTDTGYGDILSALLEILDKEQNKKFKDKFLDIEVDLSKCLFIATANNTANIPEALLDRLEKVRFTSYSDEDKIQIAQNYLLPKIIKSTGLKPEQLTFSEDVWPMVVRPLGFDAGIRELERTLETLVRKVAYQIVSAGGEGVQITSQNFREFIPDDFGVFS